MKPDLTIDEIRAARHRISARFGHDTKLLLDHYREMEKEYRDRMLKDASEQPTSAAGVQARPGQPDCE